MDFRRYFAVSRPKRKETLCASWVKNYTDSHGEEIASSVRIGLLNFYYSRGYQILGLGKDENFFEREITVKVVWKMARDNPTKRTIHCAIKLLFLVRNSLFICTQKENAVTLCPICYANHFTVVEFAFFNFCWKLSFVSFGFSARPLQSWKCRGKYVWYNVYVCTFAL